MALQMRERCERCPQRLPADGQAWICSFECSFCPACAAALGQICCNCAGELVRRPRRTTRSIG